MCQSILHKKEVFAVFVNSTLILTLSRIENVRNLSFFAEEPSFCKASPLKISNWFANIK